MSKSRRPRGLESVLLFSAPLNADIKNNVREATALTKAGAGAPALQGDAMPWIRARINVRIRPWHKREDLFTPSASPLACSLSIALCRGFFGLRQPKLPP